MNHIQYFSLIFLILKGNDFICIGLINLIYTSQVEWKKNSIYYRKAVKFQMVAQRRKLTRVDRKKLESIKNFMPKSLNFYELSLS
jgi:hypothetical protein